MSNPNHIILYETSRLNNLRFIQSHKKNSMSLDTINQPKNRENRPTRLNGAVHMVSRNVVDPVKPCFHRQPCQHPVLSSVSIR